MKEKKKNIYIYKGEEYIIYQDSDTNVYLPNEIKQFKHWMHIIRGENIWSYQMNRKIL